MQKMQTDTARTVIGTPGKIFDMLNKYIFVVLLSASTSTDMLEVVKKFMRDPFQIEVEKEELTLESVNIL